MLKKPITILSACTTFLSFASIVKAEEIPKQSKIQLEEVTKDIMPSYYVQAPVLNIRKKPTTSSTVIGKLSRGTKLDVRSSQNGWYKIKWENEDAYVSGIYVKKMRKSSSLHKSDVAKNTNYRVTVHSLHVRSDPSTINKIIGSAKKDTHLNVQKKLANGWLQITWNGKTAYVHGDYVSDSTIVTPPTVEKATHLVTVHSLNVRIGPDTTYSVVGKLKQGDTIAATNIHEDWIEFIYNGKTAFVSKNYTTLINNHSLSPTFAQARNVKKVIVLDAGHGGYEPGTISDTGILEKDITLSIVKKAKIALEKKGYVVILTRDTDRYLSLKERTDVANDVQANMFLSIHGNSAANKNVTGIESWYYSYHPSPSNLDNENESLARHVQTALMQELQLHNRGIRNGDFYVIRNTSMPSALLELGFLSNHHESIFLSQSNTQSRIAKAIAQGVETFFQN